MVKLCVSKLQSEFEREWLYERLESGSREELSNEEKKRLALLMVKSQNFDNFLANKFPSVKRYGGEGAEAMMPMFDELVKRAGAGNKVNLRLGRNPLHFSCLSLQSVSRKSLSECRIGGDSI